MGETVTGTEEEEEEEEEDTDFGDALEDFLHN